MSTRGSLTAPPTPTPDPRPRAPPAKSGPERTGARGPAGPWSSARAGSGAGGPGVLAPLWGPPPAARATGQITRPSAAHVEPPPASPPGTHAPGQRAAPRHGLPHRRPRGLRHETDTATQHIQDVKPTHRNQVCFYRRTANYLEKERKRSHDNSIKNNKTLRKTFYQGGECCKP